MVLVLFFKLGFLFPSSQFKTKIHLNESSPMAASALPSSSPSSSSSSLPLHSSNPNSSLAMSSPPSAPDSPPHLDDLDQINHFSAAAPAPAPFPVVSSSSPPSATTDRMLNLPTQPTQSPPAPTLLSIAFNQNQTCFSAGTTSGFRIFNCDPLSEIYRCENLPPLSNPACVNVGGGGIEVAQMLFRHTLFALVGGGPAPQYPLNKVLIWSGHEAGCIGELTFNSEVKSVRLKRDSIVVVLLKKIYVYEFPSLKVEHQVETMLNPRGLCEVSHTSGSRVLVCPGQHKGQVRVEHYSSNRTKYISAHDSRIACLALTNDGRFLATASSKGTLIRVHNTLDGSLLQEVRRGSDRAEIYSLAFSSTAQWLAASSDKGTIHVFNLRFESGSLGSGSSCSASEVNNSSPSAVSHLSFIRGVLPKYFSSEWSVAQFRLQEGLKSIVAFGHQKNTVMIIGMDGSFYRCQYDPVMGGEMTQLEYLNFLELKKVL